MLLLIGKKLKMKSFYTLNNIRVPVTILKCNPCTVLDVNITTKKVTIGYQEMYVHLSRVKNSQLGIYNSYKSNCFKYIKTFKTLNTHYNIGDQINLTALNIDQKISICSTTKGKGFTGNIKCNKFKRGPMSHGSKHHRLQGSLGAGTNPGRVFPGKRMPKRTGNVLSRQVTTVVFVDIIKNYLYVLGSIAGHIGTIVYITLKF